MDWIKTQATIRTPEPTSDYSSIWKSQRHNGSYFRLKPLYTIQGETEEVDKPDMCGRATSLIVNHWQRFTIQTKYRRHITTSSIIVVPVASPNPTTPRPTVSYFHAFRNNERIKARCRTLGVHYGGVCVWMGDKGVDSQWVRRRCCRRRMCRQRRQRTKRLCRPLGRGIEWFATITNRPCLRLDIVE